MSPLRVTLAMLAALIVAPGVDAAGAHGDALRIMTFNVRLPLAADGAERWEARRDLFVATIAAEQPDLIGTQELYREQGDYVVAKLPQYAWFGRGRRGDDGDEHMGVFYRRDALHPLESGDFWLSDTPDVPGSMTWGHPFPRLVTWARFERRDGRRFVLLNTHLPYRDEDESARERGARLIVQRIAAIAAGEPVVLTGDFNCAPDSRTHAILGAQLHDVHDHAPRVRGPAATFHGFSGKPDRRIDWILVRGFAARRVDTVTTHRGALYPSDHFPVVADLRWPAP